MQDFKFLRNNKPNDLSELNMVFDPNQDITSVRSQNIMASQRDCVDGIIQFISSVYHTNAFELRRGYNTFGENELISFIVLDVVMLMDESCEFFVQYIRGHRHFVLTFSCDENFINIYNVNLSIMRQ